MEIDNNIDYEDILANLDDYEAWDTAETIEEARDKRSKLAMSFFSRAVVIEDTNDYSIVN